jgi:hypothetical protein
MEEATLECSKCNGPAYKTQVSATPPIAFLILCRACLETQNRCSCG